LRDDLERVKLITMKVNARQSTAQTQVGSISSEKDLGFCGPQTQHKTVIPHLCRASKLHSGMNKHEDSLLHRRRNLSTQLS